MNVLRTEGLINPNGVQRDGGAALRAALFGFKYNGKDGTQADSTIDQKPLAGQDGQEGKVLVDSLIAYIQTKGPLRERGELSELAVFNAGDTLAGVDMDKQLDRNREQLFRRLVECTTTRGDTFTAYIVGQSLRETGSATDPQVASTIKRKVTFRLIPQFSDPSLQTEKDADLRFDGTSQAARDVRFSKPSSYNVEILRVSE